MIVERKDYFYISSILILFLFVVTGYSGFTSDLKSLTVDPVVDTVDQTQSCELKSSISVDGGEVVANVTVFESPEGVSGDTLTVNFRSEEYDPERSQNGYTCVEGFEGEGEYRCGIVGDLGEVSFAILSEPNYNPFEDRCESEVSSFEAFEENDWVRTLSYSE